MHSQEHICLCEAYEDSFMTSEKQNSLLNAMLAELLSLRRQSFRRGHYGNSKKISGCFCGFKVRQVKSVSIPCSK